jgi:hypothetical protein
MDPLLAARTRKPRRTNSAPGSAFRAARNRSVPSALFTSLFGKREALPEFAIKTLDRAADEPLGDTSDVKHHADATRTMELAVPPKNLSADVLQDIDMQDILDQMNESSTHVGSGGSKHRKSQAQATQAEADDGAEPRVFGDDEPLSGSVTGEDSRTPSKERTEDDASARGDGDTAVAVGDDDDEDGTFDVDEMRYYFNKLRETTGYCSDTISQFVQELWEQLGEGETGMLLLGRDAMAAPAAHVDRKRRLFGDKEPELHQRVLGVLNKVTDEQSKYREIKNELMRLPLPEADPQSLELVVKCFFAKAVREKRFSSHYADLVEEICRVPPNQIQLGDTTQSLSYRLRVALLRRCQEEFANHKSMSEIAREAAKASLTPDEVEQIKASEKDKLCGNVKFVGELYLRKMVSARILQLILVQLLCGTNSMDALQAPLPPSYVPEAYECDQIITLLMTTGETFTKTEIGTQTIAAVMRIIKYFAQHHPVQRTRFVLLDLLDADARKFGKKVPGAPKVRTVLPASVAGPSESAPSRTPVTIARRPDGASVVSATPQRPGPPPALSADSPMSSMNRTPSGSMPSSAVKGSAPASPLTVGTPKRPLPSQGPGKAMIPAPRSAGSTTLLSSAPSSPPALVGRTPPTLELIGPLMSSLVSSSDVSGMAREIIITFSSAKLVMDIWIQRALGLIKAETERGQIAPLLIALHKEHDIPAQELRQTALDALYRCVELQLYEGGFRLWKFWAQIVAGDAKGIVLDDQLHNQVYQHVLESTLDPETKDIDKSIARSFIVDVINVENASHTASKRFCDVRAPYHRFRPLNVLTNAAIALVKGRSAVAVAETKLPAPTIPATKCVLDIVAWPSIAKLQDAEITTYVALLKGKPTREELFQFLRSEKVFANAFTPAKVLSAIYHAEYAEQARSFLDESLDLLVFVIDGANRNLRELALVLEMYYCSKGITSAQRTMHEGQRWISRLKMNGVVTIETHTLAHQLLQHDRDAELAIGPSREATHRMHHHQGQEGRGGGHHSVRAIQHH